MPSLARHKRGCHCKRSMCLKKYCECYQVWDYFNQNYAVFVFPIFPNRISLCFILHVLLGTIFWYSFFVSLEYFQGAELMLLWIHMRKTLTLVMKRNLNYNLEVSSWNEQCVKTVTIDSGCLQSYLIWHCPKTSLNYSYAKKWGKLSCSVTD